MNIVCGNAVSLGSHASVRLRSENWVVFRQVPDLRLVREKMIFFTGSENSVEYFPVRFYFSLHYKNA